MKTILLLSIFTLTNCLIRDTELLVDYSEANLDLYPRQFEVTAPLVLANPFDGCDTFINGDKVKGKIVIVMEAGRCYPQEKTKRIAELEGVGAILVGLRGSLGLYHNWAPPGNSSILLPALSTSYVDFIGVIQRVAKNQNVTFTIQDTTENPWLELGHSAIGILFQIYFEILAFGAFSIASYKLVMYSLYRGIKFHVTPICLMLEIMASTLRIVMMARPLSFYKFGYSVAAEAFFVGYSNVLSFTTDLLITFYWQEVLVQYNQQSGFILNNLRKFRIPFVITVIGVWTIDTVSSLSRLHIIRTFENAIYFSAIVNIILIGLIAIFLLFTGRMILVQLKNVSGNFGKRQVSKLTKFIIATGILIVLQIVGTALNLTAFTNISVKTHLFVYWLFWTGLFGSSITKVLMFDVPKSTKQSEKEKQSVDLSSSLTAENLLEMAERGESSSGDSKSS